LLLLKPRLLEVNILSTLPGLLKEFLLDLRLLLLVNLLLKKHFSLDALLFLADANWAFLLHDNAYITLELMAFLAFYVKHLSEPHIMYLETFLRVYLLVTLEASRTFQAPYPPLQLLQCSSKAVEDNTSALKQL